MAHTLQLINGDEGTTLDIGQTGASGYHLTAYNPLMSAYGEQRNSSLYVPGDYSVMGKYGNIVETITLEIVGTSRDDLYIKLRALFRLIEVARDFVQFPNGRSASYIAYKPDSVTNTAYSCIYGGRVDVPGIDAAILSGAGGEGEFLSNTITGIVVTIEREPFWRSIAPTTDYTTGTSLVSDTFTNPWRSINIGSVAGDIETPIAITIANPPATLDTFFIGYSSTRRKGSASGAAGLTEVEAGAAYTDTSFVVDATASPGSGNSKATCTFATTTTDAERISTYLQPGYGYFRLFLRCKLTAAGSVGIHANVASSVTYMSKVSGPVTTITNTAWRMIDLGTFAMPPLNQQPWASVSLSRTVFISAARLTGTPNLDMDFVYFMPVDEGLIQCKGALGSSTTFILYNNKGPGMNVLLVMDQFNMPAIFPQWSGYIRPVPGQGYLYFLGGDANFENTYAASGNKYTITVNADIGYLAPRGNG